MALAWILPISFLVALTTAGLVMRLRILDHPNSRSSHTEPTPRGGGLGILVATLVAMLLLPAGTPFELAARNAIMIFAGLAAFLGLLDDLATLSERFKFLVLTGISLGLAASIGPVTDLGISLPWILGLLGTALWVFTTANAVNFMDGSDGIMAASLIPACLALGFMADGMVAGSSLALAAALAGFSVLNAPILAERGRLFAGDVGSLGAAVLFAGLVLFWVTQSESGSVWLAPLLIMPLLGDVLLTMAARARAGRRLFSAHRAHAYQLLLRTGKSHRSVALHWGALSLACAILALAGHHGPYALKLGVFVVGTLGFTIIHRTIRHRAREAGEDVTL